MSTTRNEGQVGPRTVTLNGKIYVSVTEVHSEDGSTYYTRRVRIFSYNGDDNAPHWNDVQGNLDVNGNPNAVLMSVANGKLYVVTNDFLTGAFDAWVYNGDDGAPAWTNLGHIGLRVDEPWSLVTCNGKLYLFGCNFQNNQYVQCDLDAAVYNGNDSAPHWQSLSLGGVGVGTGGQFDAIDVSGKLYVFFADDVQIGYANQPTHTRCFAYSGDDNAPAWTDVSGANGHINIDPRVQRSGAAAVGNKLYVAIPENDTPRVHVYNGNEAQPAWTAVDNGGLHGARTRTSLLGGGVALGVVGTTLHALWSEHGGIQSAVYGGDDAAPAWTLDRGTCASEINYNERVDWYANATSLVANAGKLYATWSEATSTGAAKEQTRVAVRR